MKDDWIIIKNFPHSKGAHCESTSLRDCINYLGFNFSEAMIFGLDATMGFSYFGKWADESGLLIGGKSRVISEKSLACRVLGITIEKCEFSSPNKALIDAKSNIDSGNPLLIMTDMGYLSYFDWEEEFHFGGHLISLIGYNDKKKLAMVCDNNFENPIELKIADLNKARDSKKGSKWLWPRNVRYILKKRTDGKRPPLSSGIKLAISQTVKNMLAASTNHNGILGLEKFADSISNWENELKDNPKRAKTTLKMIYGYIEEFGTGGAIFRNLYVEFLEEVLSLSEIREGKRPWKDDEIELLEKSIPLLKESAKNWTDFATHIKEKIGTDGDNSYDKLDNNGLEENIREIIRLEKSFFLNLNGLKL